MKNPHFKATNSLTYLVLCCFHDEFSIHVDNLTDKERSFDVRLSTKTTVMIFLLL